MLALYTVCLPNTLQRGRRLAKSARGLLPRCSASAFPLSERYGLAIAAFAARRIYVCHWERYRADILITQMLEHELRIFCRLC